MRPGSDPELLNLVSNQWELSRVVLPMLHVGLEFDEGFAEPAGWWPHGRRGGLVLDRVRSFGARIVARAGVRTSILAAAVEGNGQEMAARMFNVSRTDVRRAVAFERSSTE